MAKATTRATLTRVTVPDVTSPLAVPVPRADLSAPSPDFGEGLGRALTAVGGILAETDRRNARAAQANERNEWDLRILKTADAAGQAANEALPGQQGSASSGVWDLFFELVEQIPNEGTRRAVMIAAETSQVQSLARIRAMESSKLATQAKGDLAELLPLLMKKAIFGTSLDFESAFVTLRDTVERQRVGLMLTDAEASDKIASFTAEATQGRIIEMAATNAAGARELLKSDRAKQFLSAASRASIGKSIDQIELRAQKQNRETAQLEATRSVKAILLNEYVDPAGFHGTIRGMAEELASLPGETRTAEEIRLELLEGVGSLLLTVAEVGEDRARFNTLMALMPDTAEAALTKKRAQKLFVDANTTKTATANNVARLKAAFATGTLDPKTATRNQTDLKAWYLGELSLGRSRVEIVREAAQLDVMPSNLLADMDGMIPVGVNQNLSEFVAIIREIENMDGLGPTRARRAIGGLANKDVAGALVSAMQGKELDSEEGVAIIEAFSKPQARVLVAAAKIMLDGDGDKIDPLDISAVLEENLVDLGLRPLPHNQIEEFRRSFMANIVIKFPLSGVTDVSDPTKFAALMDAAAREAAKEFGRNHDPITSTRFINEILFIPKASGINIENEKSKQSLEDFMTTRFRGLGDIGDSMRFDLTLRHEGFIYIPIIDNSEVLGHVEWNPALNDVTGRIVSPEAKDDKELFDLLSVRLISGVDPVDISDRANIRWRPEFGNISAEEGGVARALRDEAKRQWDDGGGARLDNEEALKEFAVFVRSVSKNHGWPKFGTTD